MTTQQPSGFTAPITTTRETDSRALGRMIRALLPAPVWSAAYRAIRVCGAMLRRKEFEDR